MKKILPLIFVGLLASILIFYKFNLIPKNLAFDEVEFAKLALSLQNKPYSAYSTLATGHSTLYFYILLASFKTFGINIFALRFPAAIFGILSVIFFYLIMKKVFQQLNNEAMKQCLPSLLSFIFLSSHWFLNFARFSFEATFLLFLELVSIYFLISKKSFFISGLFSGLAFLSYTPGRIFFLLPLGLLIFKLVNSLTRKQFNNETPLRPSGFEGQAMKQLLLFIVPLVIITTPLTSYLLTNKDTRIDQQFFLKNHEMPIQEKLTGLWHNISSTALMFNIKGDVNGRHNYPLKPALNPILGILFVVGIIVTMKSTFAKASADKQWNKNNNKLFLLYFFLSLFPALMTYPWENPNMLRTYTVLPSVVYFIGIALVQSINRLYTNKKLIVILIMILLLSSIYELRTYFKYQSIVFNQSFEIKLPLEKAIKIKLKP